MRKNKKYIQSEVFPDYEAWKQSGISQKVFCQKHGISYSTFYTGPESTVKAIKLSNKLNSPTRNNRAHYYTHKELEVILEHFCISPEEFEMLK